MRYSVGPSVREQDSTSLRCNKGSRALLGTVCIPYIRGAQPASYQGALAGFTASSSSLEATTCAYAGRARLYQAMSFVKANLRKYPFGISSRSKIWPQQRWLGRFETSRSGHFAGSDISEIDRAKPREPEGSFHFLHFIFVFGSLRRSHEVYTDKSLGLESPSKRNVRTTGLPFPSQIN